MQTVELMKHGDKSLVLCIKDGKVNQYVSCTDYDSTREFGEQWVWGHYFTSLESAMNYWNSEVLNRPTYDRLVELATKFKDGLLEDDIYSAICYFDDECDMTDEEKEFFGIEEE